MKTLCESAMSAVMPWNSIDAGDPLINALPQQSIDICLRCPHNSDHCEECRDWQTTKLGRPRIEIDTALLREMLTLKRCEADMCAALGVSRRTLARAKKRLILKGGD